MEGKNKDNPIYLKNFLLAGNGDSKKYRKVYGIFRGYIGDECMDELRLCFNQNLVFNLKTKEPEVALKDSFASAEETINKIGYKCAATALILLLPDDDTIVLGNVGSCSAKMFRKNKNNKKLEPLFFPHDFNNLTKEERIKKSGNTIVPIQGKSHFLDAIPVTRAFGLPGKYEAIKPIPEIVSYAIQKDDKVLLIGSSEFFDCFTTNQLISILDENVTSREICIALKNALDEKIMQEKNFVPQNIAFVVVRSALLTNCDVKVARHGVDDLYNAFKEFDGILEEMVCLSCFSKKQIDAITKGRESIKKWCEKFEKIKKS